MTAISRRRFSGVMCIGSVAVSMLFAWLSTHNDLPFGTGALSGGLTLAGRLVDARPLLLTYPREAWSVGFGLSVDTESGCVCHSDSYTEAHAIDDHPISVSCDARGL